VKNSPELPHKVVKEILIPVTWMPGHPPLEVFVGKGEEVGVVGKIKE